MIQFKHVLFILLILFSTSFSTFSQEELPSIFDKMYQEDVLNIILTADFDSLENSRRTDDYVRGIISFENQNGETEFFNIKLRTRGRFRRKICEMPPLKLDFSKKDLAKAGLASFDDMKLVTHCTDNRYEAADLVVKEHLAYKMYGRLTPLSYRTQLVKITYRDINTGRKTRRIGMLIEDTAQLAHRMKAKNCKDCYNPPQGMINPDALKTVHLFNYMIGNTDYSISAMKNVRLFRRGQQLIPVPYDFDFSGFVNAPYAIPNPDYQLTSNRERVFLGTPKDLYHLHAIKSLFYSREKVFFQLIEKCDELDRAIKEDLRTYLQSFYYNINQIATTHQLFLSGSQKRSKVVSK